MVSVDSLSSNIRYSDHPSPTLSSHHIKEPATKSADMSYMPSSPPTYPPSYHRTPLPSDSPPKYPAAPVQSSVPRGHIETPLQESARQSGRALQHVLTASHAESRPGELSSRDAIFNGFSAGTRRQLRESLYAGQSLATPPLASQTNFGLGLTGAPHLAAPVPTFSSPFHSPVRRNSNSVTHRLPTPDEKEATSEPTVSGEVVYPSITKKLQETPLESPHTEYDAMSCVATGQTKATMPAVKSPLQHQTLTEEDTLTSSEVSREANGQLRSELQQDTPQHDSPRQEDSEEAKDIWQEEASRSIDDDDDSDDTPPIFRDELYVKPRRAKLPGTWRRTSQANFHYSDSPEPEDVSTRKVSAATSASGIMTPPITEDERLTERAMTPGEESESDGAEEDSNEGQGAEHAKGRPDEDGARSTVRSNQSQKSNLSTETDDTGGFWHSNLPAVFNRPSTRRARTTISPDTALNLDLSVDESFPPGSPLRNTMLDFSPEKTERTYEKRERIIGAIKRAPKSDSGLLPTPLRLSLLKSSKIRGSPGNSISLKNQEHDMNGSLSQADSSSMASDARQLHNEFTQQLKATRDNSTIDLTQEPSSEDSEMTVSVQSYVEELNRESPMKVGVNFNDSVAESARTGYTHDNHGRSIMLSPKKQYPFLFDHAPSLDASKGDGSTDAATSGRPRVRKGGFVSRLTDSFWDAVVAAPPPADAKPTILISPSPSSAPSATECKQTVPSAISTTPSVPDHVLRLRRKYGLLPHVHPFTYQHIRTLHRMLNSARGMTSGTCIIPASGPLPADLASLVNQTKTNDLDQSFTWTEVYAHVVDSFMSLLLPAPERQRLVDHTTREWGDEEALRYKGYDSKGRNGTDKVFPVEIKGEIMSLWVANIMQDIAWKEEMNAKKRMIRDMMANVSKTEDSEMLQNVKPAR
ncbi:hypothetical protein BDV97DRAFT_351929 [Delphinella strobiligena]|nr:hypothetical protein BDV97DRAFT_351929 [Delphinella strobiligena]